ncbi:hypothetical protein ANN_06772 [Periplaneta americana]|uniref:Uncharacterized protein n=1 Tax=Periplaneta americana TaxID=6978 RepID=A0ABQ8TED7_PERAM|nr:hypothetical protein ANN_06772 [Periplaneta americana]
MAGLCEGGNEPPGSLKASNVRVGFRGWCTWCVAKLHGFYRAVALKTTTTQQSKRQPPTSRQRGRSPEAYPHTRIGVRSFVSVEHIYRTIYDQDKRSSIIPT